MEGYKEAQIINDCIEHLSERESITSLNYYEWLKFARTIRTSCEIIEMEANRIYNEFKYS